MTTYRNIHGRSIRAVATDPTAEVSEGEIWYNTGSDTFKSIVSVEAWSSSGSVITARYGMGSADQGSQTAGLIFGGATPFSTATEEYNGSGFSSGGALPTATAEIRGAGTQTAALGFMGLTNPSTHTNASFEYNGSSWGSPTTMNTSRYDGGGNGTQTAGLGFGGYTTTSVANTEEYNGSSWTNVNSMNTARYSFGSAGVQTSAVAVAGVTPPGRVNSVEEYDGTNWTTGTNYPLTISGIEGFGATNTAAIFAGGATSPPTLVTTCNSYDGTSFSSIPALGNSAASGGTGGTNTAGLFMSGIRTAPGTAGGDTEEYNKSANVITGAAWAAGGNQNTPRVYYGGSGPVTSALIIGGFNGPGLGGFMDDSETYNGTSWTTITNFPYNAVGMFGIGDAEAFIGGAGYNNSAAHVATTAEWSGSSWTSGGNVNQLGQGAAGTGTQTAAILGNRSTAPGAQSEEYDGSSWTTTPATNSGNAGGGNGMAGTQTAALMYGGGPTSIYTRNESWNGSSWTSVGALNTGRGAGSMGGSQTAALFGGGTLSPPTSNTTQTEQYNGTSWATTSNMATARFYQRGGSHTAADSQLATSGSPNGSAISAATEEFTEGTTTLNVKTLTQS